MLHTFFTPCVNVRSSADNICGKVNAITFAFADKEGKRFIWGKNWKGQKTCMAQMNSAVLGYARFS